MDINISKIQIPTYSFAVECNSANMGENTIVSDIQAPLPSTSAVPGTQEISHYWEWSQRYCIEIGQTIDGLLNATFENAVELIVSSVAIHRNLIRLVQELILEQNFNRTAAQTGASSMILACIALSFLAAFRGDANAEINQEKFS
ncbi:14181_t:CDS:2 [Ambispora leptoticha]|uniref:14181_t:CDS:1 n=1 Tax=Ambispora leptoticha TaxID=144679 RepID=A0A9N9F2B7_9GLOM|nr:14181_t:CDS:2 [Ambispora leptoticha]